MSIISTVTLASDAAEITWSSIPSDGTDLMVVFSGRQTNTTPTALVRFNNDSGSNYNYLATVTFGSTPTYTAEIGVTQARIVITNSNATSNFFSQSTAYIYDYAGNKKKEFDIYGIVGTSDTSRYLVEGRAAWLNTAAVNTISIIGNGANLAAGSTASLYKITKV